MTEADREILNSTSIWRAGGSRSRDKKPSKFHMYSLQMYLILRSTAAYSSADQGKVEGFFGIFFFLCRVGGGRALKLTCTVGVWGAKQLGDLVVS